MTSPPSALAVDEGQLIRIKIFERQEHAEKVNRHILKIQKPKIQTPVQLSDRLMIG